MLLNPPVECQLLVHFGSGESGNEIKSVVHSSLSFSLLKLKQKIDRSKYSEFFLLQCRCHIIAILPLFETETFLVDIPSPIDIGIFTAHQFFHERETTQSIPSNISMEYVSTLN